MDDPITVDDEELCYTCHKVLSVDCEPPSVTITVHQSPFSVTTINICQSCVLLLDFELNVSTDRSLPGSHILPESKIIVESPGTKHRCLRCLAGLIQLDHPVSIQDGILDKNRPSVLRDLSYEFVVYLCDTCANWKRCHSRMPYVASLKFPSFDKSSRVLSLPPISSLQSPAGDNQHNNRVSYPVSMLVNKAKSLLCRFKESATLSSPPSQISSNRMYLHSDAASSVHWSSDGFSFAKTSTRVVKIQNTEHVIRETTWVTTGSAGEGNGENSFKRRTITSSELMGVTVVHYLGEIKEAKSVTRVALLDDDDVVDLGEVSRSSDVMEVSIPSGSNNRKAPFPDIGRTSTPSPPGSGGGTVIIDGVRHCEDVRRQSQREQSKPTNSDHRTSLPRSGNGEDSDEDPDDPDPLRFIPGQEDPILVTDLNEGGTKSFPVPSISMQTARENLARVLDSSISNVGITTNSRKPIPRMPTITNVIGNVVPHRKYGINLAKKTDPSLPVISKVVGSANRPLLERVGEVMFEGAKTPVLIDKQGQKCIFRKDGTKLLLQPKERAPSVRLAGPAITPNFRQHRPALINVSKVAQSNSVKTFVVKAPDGRIIPIPDTINLPDTVKLGSRANVGPLQSIPSTAVSGITGNKVIQLAGLAQPSGQATKPIYVMVKPITNQPPLEDQQQRNTKQSGQPRMISKVPVAPKLTCDPLEPDRQDPVDPVDSLLTNLPGPEIEHLVRSPRTQTNISAELAEECIFNKRYSDVIIYSSGRARQDPLHTHSLLLAALSGHMARILRDTERNAEGKYELVVMGVSLSEIDTLLEEVIGTMLMPPKNNTAVTFSMSADVWGLFAGYSVRTEESWGRTWIKDTGIVPNSFPARMCGENNQKSEDDVVDRDKEIERSKRKISQNSDQFSKMAKLSSGSFSDKLVQQGIDDYLLNDPAFREGDTVKAERAFENEDGLVEVYPQFSESEEETDAYSDLIKKFYHVNDDNLPVRKLKIDICKMSFEPGQRSVNLGLGDNESKIRSVKTSLPSDLILLGVSEKSKSSCGFVIDDLGEEIDKLLSEDT